MKILKLFFKNLSKITRVFFSYIFLGEKSHTGDYAEGSNLFISIFLLIKKF